MGSFKLEVNKVLEVLEDNVVTDEVKLINI
jgi:hypothetical protein